MPVVWLSLAFGYTVTQCGVSTTSRLIRLDSTTSCTCIHRPFASLR